MFAAGDGASAQDTRQQMLISPPLAAECLTNSEDLKNEFIRKDII